MSFQFNSDRETIKGLSPTVIGSNQFIIKSGSGATEREIFRALVNDGGQTRIGVNRTGRRVDKIIINSPGFGFTTEPVVEIDAPDQAGGVQAEAEATIQDGIITNVNVTEPGDGYTFSPGVSVTGGGGAGADLAATIDSIDYELDINGAIRTSTSIISDTATILNLDIENFATANTKFRAPHLKNYINGGGAEWNANVVLETGEFRWYGGNLYQVTDGGLTGNIPPTHSDGSELNGQATFKHVGYRVNDPLKEFYQELPASGLFPRSITPSLGDRSDKIATTEYVLNLATNDVGGRIYVSEQIGNDLNDGRSAAQPVRTIKRAAQLAWATPGVKESLIVSGGEYREDNPISLPPDCSVVGDNLRLVIIRPNNPGKDIFKFGDKNYVIGVTYRDKLDVNGNPEGTWKFAMVFDDKQRIVFDDTTNGDFGTEFQIGTRIVGEDKFRLTFSQNGGLNKLGPGVGIRGVNSTALGVITSVIFDVAEGEETQDADGTAEYDATSGAFTSGEVFRYGGTDTVTYALSTVYSIGQLVWFNQNVYEVTNVQGDARSSNSAFPIHEDGDPPEYVGNVEFTWLRDAYTFLSENIVSIRAEGEVVFSDFDTTSTLPIIRVDAGFQGTFNDGFQSEQFGTSEDLGGIVLYTNSLLLASNIHDYKEGQEIFIEGMPSSPNDLTALNGRQRIYKVLEDADGRARRFVIPKKLPSVTANDIEISGATVRSASHSVTLSLTNSPNKFGLSEPVARRYQDACLLLRNNIDVIADEVVGRINEEFKKEFWSVYNVTANTFDIYVGTTGDAHTYVSGGTVTHNGVQYPISGFTYDNIVTGVATVTTSGNWIGVINEDDLVSLNDITLQCTNNGEIIQKEYPSFSIPTGDYKCRRDIGHFINAMIRDLEFGSNFNTIEAAKKYLDGTGSAITYVDNEIIQTVRALEYARELSIYAIRKWRIGDGTVGNPQYTLQYTSLQKYIDPTVIDDTSSPACANVVNAFNTLAYLFVDVLANNTSGTYLDAAYLVARNRHVIAEEAYQDTKVQYPSMGLSDINERKCRRDINHALSGLIRDLALGGNAGIVTAAEFYFSGASLTGIPEAQRVQTLYAFERAQFYTIAAMRNWSQTGNTVTTTPTNASYDSSTGLLELTIPTPVTSLVANQDRIAFKEGAITFRCDMGSGLQDHASPTIYDSNYGDSFLITSVVNGSGTVTIQCNVGDAGSAAGVTHIYKESLTDGTILIHDFLTTSSVIPQFEDWSILIDTGAGAPIGQFTPTFAEYDPSNGDFTITVPSGHGVTTNDTIRLAPESFVFTCAMDGNKTEHALPEIGQLAYGTSLDVTAVTATTITMNVGASGPDVSFTPQSGTTYDPATGDLTLKIGAHTLDVGEGIVIADNSLTFTCDMDNNQSQKTYPRPGIDPYAGRSIKITKITSDTITVNAGVSKQNQYFTPTTGTTYDSSTGDLTVNVGQHGLGVGRSVVLEDNSFTFVCDYNGDNYQTPKTYPRPGQDTNVSGKSLEITSVGFTSHTVETATYAAGSGDMTITITGHGFADGDYIKISDGSLDFTCELDGNTVTKSYPRAGYDYPSGRWLQISNVTADTFDINIGPSSYTGVHTFVGADANGLERQDGTFTINVGATVDQSDHLFVSATLNAIKHEPQSTHTFIPDQPAGVNAVSHLPQSVHQFVRAETNAASAYPAGVAPLCANVETAIITEYSIFSSILSGSVLPGDTTKTTGDLFDTTGLLTYPSSFIYDENNTRIAIRGRYDDYPIIEASPYTQNSSVISFLGGGGAEVDGAKVKQPNCPFPGLQPDGTATFPNQGKSMVASAFTIVSFGGTGYKIINDGYVQLVSVFVIFCEDGCLAESGGYCSITNSATNFGTFALRSVGFREEAYSFDVGTISEAGQTISGKTTFKLQGLGRKPLEHYVVKIDGYRNYNESIEYFIDVVEGSGEPTITLESNLGLPGEWVSLSDPDPNNPTIVQGSELVNETIRLHRPSIVNSSSHTWEYAGSGTNYLALPENGGVKVEAFEQVPQNYGRVYVSGTDELGDFKVGTFAKIENRTGAITFTGTVSISEVEFLKLKGGDVVVTGFSSDNTLGGTQSSDSLISTQKAVRDYIVNNLGPYINKPYSTNPVPRALVELTDSGKINADQLPPIRPFSVFTVVNETERLRLEGALAGDIAIQDNSDTTGATESYILNNDNSSLFLAYPTTTGTDGSVNYQFSVNNIYTGATTGGKIQATESRIGVVYQINITDGGEGYTVAPQVNFVGGNQQIGAVDAKAYATIAGGKVVTVVLEFDNGYIGGKGYTTAPSVLIDAPAVGTTATAEAFIESRLYGDIVNNIKITDADTIQTDNATPVTVELSRVVNTSGTSADNWVSLSSNIIDAGDIQSGIISTARLAGDETAANSFTFLRGDQSYAPVVQSLKGPENRYFLKTLAGVGQGSSQLQVPYSADIIKGHSVDGPGIADDTLIDSFIVSLDGQTITITLSSATDGAVPINSVINFTRSSSPIQLDSNYSLGNFIDSVVIADGGSNCTIDGTQTSGTARDVSLSGGTGTGLKANITVVSGVVTNVVVVDGGQQYSQDFTVDVFPPELGGGSGLVLEAKRSTTNKMYANTSIDIARVTDAGQDDYGTLGIARFKKDQFNIGSAGDGSISLKVGENSNLDADTLDGFEGSYYTNATNITSGTLNKARLTGSYDISITQQSANTRRLYWQNANDQLNDATDITTVNEGIVIVPKNNGINGLDDTPDPQDPQPYLLMNIRASESAGGVRQLAFTDGPGDDSGGGFWFRGTNSSLTTFKNWHKVWTSGSDGSGSGLDADRLDSRQGSWLQNSQNQTSGTLRNARVPIHQTRKTFKDKISLYEYSNDSFEFFCDTLDLALVAKLSASPFTVGSTLILYDTSSGTGGNVASIVLEQAQVYSTGDDQTEWYYRASGYLVAGSIVTSGDTLRGDIISMGGSDTSGTNQRCVVTDYGWSNYATGTDEIPSQSYSAVEIAQSSGTATVRLGRNVGNVQTTPSINFHPSGSTDWQAQIIAEIGTTGTQVNAQQTGKLTFNVLDGNSLYVNGSNRVWNEVILEPTVGTGTTAALAGSSTYTGTDSADFVATTPEENVTKYNIVMRDKNGDFYGNKIYAASFEGTATGNLGSDGGTIQGSLVIGDSGDEAAPWGLTVQAGPLGVTGATTITGDFKVLTDASANILFVDKAQAKVGIGQEPGSDDGKLAILGNLRNDLTLQVSDNENDQGIAFQNSDNAYTWNIYREDAGSNAADLVIAGNPTTGPLSTITDLTEYLRFEAGGNLKIDQKLGIQRDATEVLDVAGNIRVDKVIVKDDGSNPGAIVELIASGADDGGARNFRINAATDDILRIEGSDDDSGTAFTGNAAITVNANNNKVGINQDPPTGEYALEVNGNLNINSGQFTIDGNTFSGSNWTNSGTSDIERTAGRVSVGGSVVSTGARLQVTGSATIPALNLASGTFQVKGNDQWYGDDGIIKALYQNITVNTTIPANATGYSTGPININNNVTVTVSDGATWIIA